MYSGLGLSFVVPIVHEITKFGRESQLWRMSLDWMVLMATFNLTGGTLYAMGVRMILWSRKGWLADQFLDTGEMVSLSPRHLGCESSDYALSGNLR